VHQHRVVISVRATGETWFSQVSESADWVSKDRSASIAHSDARSFYHGRLEGDQAWIFHRSLGNEPLDKAGPPRPVFEPVEHVPCAAHAVQCVSPELCTVKVLARIVDVDS